MLQIVVLPGLILRFCVLKRPLSDIPFEISICFFLSLVVNYLIVVGAVSLGIYYRPLMVAILLCEVLVLTWFLIKYRKPPVKGNRKFRNSTSEFFSKHGDNSRVVLIVASAISLGIIIYTGQVFLQEWGGAFRGSDARNSWNRWALSFFNNQWPGHYWHYPQLIPANWSVSYLIQGHSEPIFSKGMMPLFVVIASISSFLFGLKHRSIAFLLFPILFVRLIRHYPWTLGFVDVPVACMSFAAVLCLFNAEKQEDNAGLWGWIVMGLVIACGVAVTKQAGLFLLAVFPLLVFSICKVPRSLGSFTLKKFLVAYLVTALIVVLPFYAYTEYLMSQGKLVSEVAYLTGGIHNEPSLWNRLARSHVLYINTIIGFKLALLCSPFFILSFLDSKTRSINLFIVIPFYLIWCMFFSYDIRNSALLTPFLALSTASGFQFFIEKVSKAKFMAFLQLRKLELPMYLKFVGNLVLFFVVLGMAYFYAEGSIQAGRGLALKW